MKGNNMIHLQQSKILNDRYFSSAIKGKPIRIIVENVSRFPAELIKFGFNETDESGSCVLPSIFNRYAAKNAEPYYIIDKTLPKEEYTQTVYWTRHEWAGRGCTNEVTELTYITKKRYHRDYFSPFSVMFTYISDETSYIVSEDIIYTSDNVAKLINTVNMVLGLFGECTIDFEPAVKPIKKICLNWDVLPPGKYPWEHIKKTINEITENNTKTQKVMMLRNCESIYDANPDFVAYGRSGFKGYVVFGFTSKNIYVLESIFPNNATYVLGGDWEEISKLSKAEILSQSLHKSRIIHSEKWEENFKRIMEEV